MSENNEKYPQLILGTDGMYEIFIREDVKLEFDTEEGINEYVKDKIFNIKGIKANRINKERNAVYQDVMEILHAI